ncbi:UvrD-helicase domain-containing protein [Streptomyces halstedii]|uniref:UvrD-helicase domain-containing protein n=1 Tax=Streptomyces halstedii TaxID=1944 RepID=A0ABS6TTD1_STRHA|nr:UvrD-helicase domain-containing protein [Streptomyces halstedii]MBV7671537.1 UvrD-helicase domain-containing protein [Streptomyces halstedii]
MADLSTPETVVQELDARRSFLLEAGAGAGKTTDLVRALQHLLGHRRPELEASGRRIACITYTNVAKRKILERISADPLVTVGTIHEFLWSVIHDYQRELWQQLLTYNDTDLRSPENLTEVTTPPVIEYSDRGRKFSDGRISHDDVIALSLRLVAAHPKLIRIIASKYPIIFVDEYQDTSPKTIELLLDHLAGAGKEPCVIGLFGDSMQKIYRSGVGAVQHERLTTITKHQNYRCSRPVVDVLNQMRPELRQEAAGERQGGEVHLFLNTDTSPGPLRLDVARTFLATRGWSLDNTKYLMLTHRGIAGTLNYPNLLEQYRQLGSHGPDDLMARAEPYIQYLTQVEALSTAHHARDFVELNSLLAQGKRHITEHADKRTINEAIRELNAVRTTGTIGDVLDLLADSRVMAVPGQVRERERRRTASGLDERHQRQADFAHGLRDVPYREVTAVTQFIDALTPFSTQHGVKGDEFENVIVVIDDSAWTMYNIGKMLAGIDKPERTQRSRNLFYVCCSRAQRGLAVVFINDLSEGATRRAHHWFASGTVHP